jgi:hypothetical protein
MGTVTAMLASGRARINDMIDSTGAQYRELARTRAWHYSIFNATALCRLAETGNQFGTNLWSHVGTAGGTLALAMEYLAVGAAGGEGAFKYGRACVPPDATQTAATAARCTPTQVVAVPPEDPGDPVEPVFDQTQPYYDLRATVAETMNAKVAAAVSLATVPGGIDMFPLIPSCRIALGDIP